MPRLRLRPRPPRRGLLVWSVAAVLALCAALAPRPVRALGLSAGLSFTAGSDATSGFVPPDTMGAVGAEHVVQLINGNFRVHAKSDGAVLVDEPSFQFWVDAGVTPDNYDFDPRVVYDPATQRWFALEVDNPHQANRFLLAVSEGPDPTGAWHAVSIDGDATDAGFADFPMLGLNADGVYLAANLFTTGATETRLYSTIVVVPKADLLLPAPSVANATSFEAIPFSDLQFSPQMTVNLDGTGGASPILAGGGIVPGIFQVARIEGPVTAPTLAGLGPGSLIFLPAAPGQPPGARQPDGAPDLDAGDARFANAVLRNGLLWTARTVEVDGRAAVQWFQIDPDTSIILQEGIVADAELDLFYPSIAVNALDQVVIGMSGSSATQYASAYAVAGETVAGVTAFGDLLLLKEGVGAFDCACGDRNRWGDYSATVVDPADPRVFWTFQEWADGGNQWATQVTQLIVPEPGGLALALLALLAAGRGARRVGQVTADAPGSS